MFAQISRRTAPGFATSLARPSKRFISTLDGYPHIYVQDDAHNPANKLLSLLPSLKRTELSIGSTSRIPPTPESFQENHKFLSTLHSVLRNHAHEDPRVQSQAQAFVSNAGASLGSGGVFFGARKSNRPGYGGGGGTGGDGAGGASGQGGAGGGGRGGYIHVSDERNPPDLGRVAWPEDIFGSLEVDSQGNFVDGSGRYQESGTYRIVTREGILGLSPYLREKLVERLQAEEQGQN